MYRIWNISSWVFFMNASVTAIGLFQGQNLVDALIDAAIVSLLLALICWMLKAWAAKSSTWFALDLSLSCFVVGALGLWAAIHAAEYINSGHLKNLFMVALAVSITFINAWNLVPVRYGRHRKFIAICSLPLGFGTIYGAIVGFQNKKFSFQK